MNKLNKSDIELAIKAINGFLRDEDNRLDHLNIQIEEENGLLSIVDVSVETEEEYDLRYNNWEQSLNKQSNDAALFADSAIKVLKTSGYYPDNMDKASLRSTYIMRWISNNPVEAMPRRK